jgi:hypothetical protein
MILWPKHQMDLTNTYRVFYQAIAQYTLFSATHSIFSKIHLFSSNEFELRAVHIRQGLQHLIHASNPPK